MSDERGSEKADTESTDTPLHAYKEGREEDVEGTIPSGDPDADEATKTGGATSGGPPGSSEEEADSGSEGAGETSDDAPEPDQGSGEKGLGAKGDDDPPPNNPDPSTQS